MYQEHVQRVVYLGETLMTVIKGLHGSHLVANITSFGILPAIAAVHASLAGQLALLKGPTGNPQLLKLDMCLHFLAHRCQVLRGALAEPRRLGWRRGTLWAGLARGRALHQQRVQHHAAVLAWRLDHWADSIELLLQLRLWHLLHVSMPLHHQAAAAASRLIIFLCSRRSSAHMLTTTAGRGLDIDICRTSSGSVDACTARTV